MAPESKVVQLWSELRKDILTGRYGKGAALPTRRELCDRFDVGESTVWLAMSRLAQEGLVERVRRRGTFVAKKLPHSERTIDCVRVRAGSGRADSSAELELVDCFSRSAREAGWIARWHHLMWEELQDLTPLVDRFSTSRGVMVLRSWRSEFMTMLHEQELATVSVLPAAGAANLLAAPYPQLTYDRAEMVRLAVRHLVSLGHRRIAFIGLANSPHRTIGFIDALHEHQLDVPARWIANISYEQTDRMREFFGQLIGGSQRAEAICCASDHVAFEAQRLLIEMGVRIPDDLAMIAADAGPLAHEAPVPITTVGIRYEDMAAQAIDLIEQAGAYRRREVDKFIDPIVLPLHLTVRSSCGAAPMEVPAAIAVA